jgi:ankyrin repeat protein
LKKKAEVDSIDSGGSSALSLACWHGKDELVSLLLRWKADINASNPMSMMYTPLMSAARFGHSSIVQKLLLAKADAESCTQFGETALSLAQHGGHKEVAKLLQGTSGGIGLCERAESTLRHAKGSFGSIRAQRQFESLVLERGIGLSQDF